MEDKKEPKFFIQRCATRQHAAEQKERRKHTTKQKKRKRQQ